MKATKKELLEMFAQSGAVDNEVYQWDAEVKHYTNDGPHGEFVTFLGDINESLTNDEHEYKCEFWTMNEAEYNGSIMAPFEASSFADEYEDENAKVFIVAINHIEDCLKNNR